MEISSNSHSSESSTLEDKHERLVQHLPESTPSFRKVKQHSLIQSCNPSLTLENSGSVARDHLASERTFLSYMRTSLTIASTGVALVQLFAISAVTVNDGMRKYSRPLGSTIIVAGLLTLAIGVVRYFSVQNALTKGHYPVARLTIAFLTIILIAIVVAVFGILVASRP